LKYVRIGKKTLSLLFLFLLFCEVPVFAQGNLARTVVRTTPYSLHVTKISKKGNVITVLADSKATHFVLSCEVDNSPCPLLEVGRTYRALRWDMASGDVLVDFAHSSLPPEGMNLFTLVSEEEIKEKN
jgi:hypothetical protein